MDSRVPESNIPCVCMYSDVGAFARGMHASERSVVAVVVVVVVVAVVVLTLTHRHNTMPSVVAGQAPITLEWKNTSENN